MFKNTYFAWLLAAVAITELLLLGIVSAFKLKPDVQVGITAYTATPLFVVTLMELARSIRLQRAAFIKDYISRFFTDKELYQTFHELIYSYPDSAFEKIEKIRADQQLDKAERPVFDAFTQMQGERQPGSRFYHPCLFQGSPEERKLDAFLGFFDVIAYYYARGFLRIEDIAGSVGYFLAVLRARKVVTEYMKLNDEAWRSPEYKTMGTTPPFSYLRRLLDDLDSYNRTFEGRIRKMQAARI
jgi:hypothetical protein